MRITRCCRAPNVRLLVLGLVVSALVHAVAAGEAVQADPGEEWARRTQIPLWMHEALCDRSDRAASGVFSQVKISDSCDSDTFLLNIEVKERKGDYEGVRDVLYQIMQWYSVCIFPTRRKVMVKVNKSSNLTNTVRKMLDKVVARLASPDATKSKCFSRTYHMEAVGASPIEWRYMVDRGVVPANGDYFADHGAFVRCPRSVYALSTDLLREFVTEEKDAWRSLEKSILIVRSSRVENMRELQDTIEKTAKQHKAEVTAVNANDGELCRKMNMHNVVIAMEWETAISALCMRRGAHLLISRDANDKEGSHWMWLHGSILNENFVRLYVVNRRKTRDELFKVDPAEPQGRLTRNFKDSRWYENARAFFIDPRP